MELGPRATRHALLLALTLLAGCGKGEQGERDGLLTAAAPTPGQGPRLTGQVPGSAAGSQPKPALATPADGAPEDADMDFTEVVGAPEVQEETDPPAPPREPVEETPEERASPAFTRAAHREYRLRQRVRRHVDDGGDFVPREDPVLRALTWLAAHQHPDGHWDPVAAPTWCEGQQVPATEASQAGQADHEVAVTSLGLLTFLGCGYTDRGDHPFRRPVLRARVWLERTMDAHGTIATSRRGAWQWGHALATLALVEGTRHTETEAWRCGAERALAALYKLRNAGSGGAWSYGLTSGAPDQTLTLWMALPLVAAKLHAEDLRKRSLTPLVEPDATALAVARAAWRTFAIQLRDPVKHGWDRDWPHALPGTLASVRAQVAALRMLDGENPREVPDLAADVAAIAAALPAWDPAETESDLLCLWLGTLAAYGGGGPPFQAWELHLRRQVGPIQVAGTDACTDAGSWPPLGRMGQALGRAGTTACLGLVGQVLYRFDKAFAPH